MSDESIPTPVTSKPASQEHCWGGPVGLVDFRMMNPECTLLTGYSQLQDDKYRLSVADRLF